MLFSDFLKATVQLLMGTAAALIAVTVIASHQLDDPLTLIVGGSWWVVAAVAGLLAGRRVSPNSNLRRLLAEAPESLSLPEVQPRRLLWNRLWVLAAFIVACGGLALFLPQVAAIGGGFSILWALSWRKHSLAVKAIEDRDGSRFYVDKSSPFKAIKIVRVPGLRRC